MLEGGAIHVDGEGTVLATEECLLNPNRNPDLSREQIEAALHDYLGSREGRLARPGRLQDETDGHVDNLACFARPGLVLLTWSEDESDPQHEISRDALARLEAASDARGRPFEVVKLPSPGPLRLSAEEAAGVDSAAASKPRRAGDRLAGSYANFYIGNERIVFPLLDERRDEQAAAILRDCFPEREVVGVPAREILLGGGNIHCITQQVPADRLISGADAEAPSEVLRLGFRAGFASGSAVRLATAAAGNWERGIVKLVIGIVRPEKANDVLEALYRAEVRGVSMSRVQGHGGELERVETYRGTTVQMGLAEKVRFEIAVSDEFVDPTVDALCEGARTGEVGDGKIFVVPLEQAVRIRTGDTDMGAVTPVEK